MRIVYHLGAHCTDEDRLVRCLLKNRGILAAEGIAVPSPTRYRKLMRDTAVQLRGQPASVETQEMLLEQILDQDEVDRMVLSWDSFLSFPAWAVRGSLYGFAGERIRAFTRIFPSFAAEFHLAIRNPATFLPALQKKVSSNGHEDVLANVDPLRLRWSDTMQQILAQNPDVPLTVWCDEETPLIWPEVLQAVAGHADGTRMVDDDDLLAVILTEAGLARYKAYCTEHPPRSTMHRRRVVTAFLEKFARPEQVEMDIVMPGWTADYVSELTDLYMEDVERIRRMPGVTMIES